MQRATRVRTATLHVEYLRCPIDRTPTAESYTEQPQLLVPLAGAFHWHVGRNSWLVDANQVMYLPAGEASRDSYPRPSDVRALLITLADAPAFPVRTALASSALQTGAARLAAGPPLDPLDGEELAIELVRRALACAGDTDPPAAADRLAKRARALFCDRGRPLALTAVARELAVSPAYLTDAFRRAEGIPLVRYQLRLRLVRALAELPHAGDLGALAVALGFASHSHFTAAFRAQFGITPSQFRDRKIPTARVRGRA